MPLEDALAANTTAVSELNENIKALLAAGGSVEPAEEEKPKQEKKTARKSAPKSKAKKPTKKEFEEVFKATAEAVTNLVALDKQEAKDILKAHEVGKISEVDDIEKLQAIHDDLNAKIEELSADEDEDEDDEEELV